MYEQFGKDVRLMAVNCWMFEIETYCLFAVVVGGGVGSVGHVLGLDRGAGGLGDLVVHGSASHLGHSVAVLNLHGDGLDDRVVNAVLGDDLTASVLDGGGDGVSHGVGGHGHGGDSVGNGDGGSVSGVSETVTKKVLGISISLGLSLGLTLGDGMVAVSDGGDNSGGVTQEVGDLHADLLVLNLLGVDGDGVADVLGAGHTGLGGQDLVCGLAVGGRGGNDGVAGMVGSAHQELRVSLGIGISCGGSGGVGQQARDGENLKVRLSKRRIATQETVRCLGHGAYLHLCMKLLILPTMASRAEVIANPGRAPLKYLLGARHTSKRGAGRWSALRAKVGRAV